MMNKSTLAIQHYIYTADGCRVVVVRQSADGCRVVVVRQSADGCRVVVVRQSDDGCRVVVVRQSADGCRVVVVRQSDDGCRVVVVRQSDDGCRVVVVRQSDDLFNPPHLKRNNYDFLVYPLFSICAIAFCLYLFKQNTPILHFTFLFSLFVFVSAAGHYFRIWSGSIWTAQVPALFQIKSIIQQIVHVTSGHMAVYGPVRHQNFSYIVA